MTIRLVEASGSGTKVGEELGEQCKDIALKLAEQFREGWARRGISKQDAITEANYYNGYAYVFFRRYHDELTGYARATGLDRWEVFAWLCPSPSKGCTDMVFSQRATRERCVYLVHNEDYDVPEEDYAVLVKVKPDDGPAYLATSYGGIWLNTGVNEAGIGIGGNALMQNDNRYGTPRDFVFRKIYSARTIGEAMQYSTPPERAGSYCNIICDEHGEMYSMEASATDFDALHDRMFLVHTNHYLSPKMAKYEAAFQQKTDKSPGHSADSIVRYNRTINLVKDLGLPMSVDGIKSILEDHVNRPWSICRHIDYNEHYIPKHERSKTCFSSIINVNTREMLLCKGNPCEGEYQLFKL